MKCPVFLSFFGSHHCFCHSKNGLLRLNFKWHPKTATFGVQTHYYLGKLDLSCIWIPTLDNQANYKLLLKHVNNLKISPFIVLNYIIMTPLANIERKEKSKTPTQNPLITNPDTLKHQQIFTPQDTNLLCNWDFMLIAKNTIFGNMYNTVGI